MPIHPRPEALERLKQLLVEKSFQFSEIPKFPLAAGGLSRYYIDCRTALSQPEARKLIGELAVALFGDRELDAVGGLELGAYPVAIAISDGFYRMTGEELRVFVVRKKPKDHGLRKWIEGDVREGDRSLVVEDVVTSGRSLVNAVERSRESGLIVKTVLALVDREEGGRATLEQAAVEFRSLLTLTDLRRFART